MSIFHILKPLLQSGSPSVHIHACAREVNKPRAHPPLSHLYGARGTPQPFGAPLTSLPSGESRWSSDLQWPQRDTLWTYSHLARVWYLCILCFTFWAWSLQVYVALSAGNNDFEKFLSTLWYFSNMNRDSATSAHNNNIKIACTLNDECVLYIPPVTGTNKDDRDFFVLFGKWSSVYVCR